MSTIAGTRMTFTTGDAGGVRVEIETEHLRLRSIKPSDKDRQRTYSLYEDPEVMRLFGAGVPMPKEFLDQYIGIWTDRWSAGDPYSMMVVFLRGTKEFIGQIVLGHGDESGQSELCGLGFGQYWNQGYGFESARAMVHEYLPETMRRGCTLKGACVKEVMATASPGNIGSIRVLEKLGMSFQRAGERDGVVKLFYSLKV